MTSSLLAQLHTPLQGSIFRKHYASNIFLINHEKTATDKPFPTMHMTSTKLLSTISSSVADF